MEDRERGVGEAASEALEARERAGRQLGVLWIGVLVVVALVVALLAWLFV